MKEGFSIWGDMDSGEPLVPSDLSMRKNKEWDVVPTNEEIHIPIKSSLSSYYPKESKIFIPFQLKEMTV